MTLYAVRGRVALAELQLGVLALAPDPLLRTGEVMFSPVRAAEQKSPWG